MRSNTKAFKKLLEFLEETRALTRQQIIYQTTTTQLQRQHAFELREIAHRMEYCRDQQVIIRISNSSQFAAAEGDKVIATYKSQEKLLNSAERILANANAAKRQGSAA